MNSLEVEAADPSTLPNRLAQLARSRRRSVRAAVIANPNVSVDTLDAVGIAFPEDLATNPLLTWLAVEDPDFLLRRRRRLRERLLAVTPNVKLLWWAVRYGDNDDRRAVLTNASAPEQLVAWLVANGGDDIAALARLHVSCPIEERTDDGPLPLGVDAQELELLAQMGALPARVHPAAVRHGSVGLRSLIAQQPDAPAGCVARLLLDDEPLVRTHASAHGHLPTIVADLLDVVLDVTKPLPELTDDDIELFAGSLYGVSLLAARPDLSEDLVERFVASEAWRERELIAASPSLSAAHTRRLAVDTDSDVRAALAGNPTIAPVVAALLSQDREDKVRSRLPAANGALTPAMFADLCSFGASGQLTVALHPECSAVRLAELARTEDWRVREACARHGRTLPGVLEVLSNDADVDVRRAVASNVNTPAACRDRLALDDSWSLRAAVAETTDRVATIERLVDDNEPLVRAALLRNRSTPAWIVSAISRSTDVEIAREVASRAETDAFILIELARIDDDTVRTALAIRDDRPTGLVARLLDQRADLASLAERLLDARHRTLPLSHGEVDAVDASDLAELFEHAPWLRSILIDVDVLPFDVLEFASRASDWIARQKVARSVGATPALLAQLAADTDHDVRAAVAANPNTSREFVEQLATDSNALVRLTVAKRPDAWAGLIEKLAVDSDDSVRTCSLEHPLCPPVLRQRRHALDNALPMEAEWFHDLVDPDGDVPIEVAKHPDAPAELLARLASNQSWRLREAVGAHPRTPPEALASLATDSDRDVRRAVAGNPSLASEIREQLVNDADITVRRIALVHPSTPDDVRQRAAATLVRLMARSTSPLTRAAAVTSPLLGSTRLRRRVHWQSLEWTERLAVAANPSTDVVTLERLSHDGNRLVAAAASERLTHD
jgi:Leucine rich repeat variant